MSSIDFRYYFRQLGTWWQFDFTFFVYVMFFTAYFSPTKAISIYINEFGEANLEAVTLLIISPIIIYSFLKSKGEWDKCLEKRK